MTLSFMPQELSLEFKIRKIKENNFNSLFLGYHRGFASDTASVLNYFGINDIEHLMDNTDVFLKNTSFNGLLFSTEYLNLIFRKNLFVFDKKIIESGLIREIPVLYSQIELRGFQSNTENILKQKKYLETHFDNVYILSTQREIIPKSFILVDTKDITKIIYPAENHPIHQWKTQMSKTNRIKLELMQ